MTYDARGCKTGMVDADMGIWSYRYNVIGELISQTDAKSQTVTMEYDTLGRMISRVEPEGETTWTYDTATNGIGKLAQVNGPNGYQQSYSYDQYGRANATTTTINGESFIQSISYDAYGRVDSKTSPTGFVIANQYNAQGFLAVVGNTDGSTVYWHADSVDAQGHALLSTLGNGLETVRCCPRLSQRHTHR
ncbi:hypothetical protein [Candidatus Vondammii sp. HM_W22]|uniref:hypothetical protein n=1 Tax=Candidatus Vondammii sp. HM_W22 TaxID=2687299 RepID=UPI001F12D8E9|nr:hypothetical protein [Candidatus Vondammii sp. HM_W22]